MRQALDWTGIWNRPRAALGLALLAAGILMTYPLVVWSGAWIEDANSGCQVWNPAPQPGESIHWNGACVDGKASGAGRLQWFQDGAETEHAEGRFSAGRIDGRGMWTWSSGHRYEGEFRDGDFHGEGTFSWPDGSRYRGAFEENHQHGQGRHESANGSIYAGPYYRGERHGEGKCFMPGAGWSNCRWWHGERINPLLEARRDTVNMMAPSCRSKWLFS